MSIKDNLVPRIGLEVHVQLGTETKLFSRDSYSFGAEPNECISAVTIAHPGSLPVPNRKAVEFAVKLGLALDCTISNVLQFDRKNYFYPDLPKGYQITQDANPICQGGSVMVGDAKIDLFKIHLEEDAGKSIHNESGNSFVDLNRAGVPLLEIVTQPDITSSKQAAAFMTEIRKLVRYLEISDGNMEEGSLRCDANISLHVPGEPLGSKVEIKNMNSFRHVARAIDLEIERQSELIAHGESIISETRTYLPDRKETLRMRTKEELNDYRYFPEPDILPTRLEREWIETVKRDLPDLPWRVKERLINEHTIKNEDATIISEDRFKAEYYFKAAKRTKDRQSLANWMVGPLRSLINEERLSFKKLKLQPETLAELVNLVDEKKISHSAAQKILPVLFKDDEVNPLEIAKKLNLLQERNVSELKPVIEEILEEFPEKVKEYHKGKKGLIGMFMGQIMKKTKGSADPKLTNKLLIELLNNRK